MGGIPRGNGAAQDADQLFEESPVQRGMFSMDLDGRHPTSQIAAEGAGDHRVSRREDGAHRDAFGDVRVGHRGHEQGDVRLAGEALELPHRLPGR